jgi:5-methyltetrahydropteroyltriglutamate--homocysteine methyltransferase
MTMSYRADQVGSLLRPPQLIDARTAYTEGRLDLDALHAVEDEAILDILEQQRQAGIDVFTDGEYRRYNFYSDMVDAVTGFVAAPERTTNWQGEGGGQLAGRAIGGKLEQKRRLTEHELPFLRAHAPGPIKVTVPSASQFVRFYKDGLTDHFYPTRADLARDLAAIVRRELEWLIAEGVPYIQIDAPNYTGLVDAAGRERLRQSGVDPDDVLDEAIAVDNASVAGLAREGVTIALHLCRGNSRSRWLSEGSYEPIAEKLFNGLDVGRLLLEYDSERAGGFEPLRFMPKGKEVVLGLITTKEGRLEAEDDLLRRIDDAATYIPRENLAISPQCGFASALLGNLLSMDDQRRKLELVGEIARKAWS